LIVKGNWQLPLDEGAAVWSIASGSLAVFAVGAEGDRRYLFSLAAGDAAFGVAASPEQPFALLGVSLETTELVKITAAQFEELPEEQRSTLLICLESWSDRLEAARENRQDACFTGSWEALQEYLQLQRREFNRRFLELEKKRLAAESDRLLKRENRNREIAAAALGELASVVKPKLGESGETLGEPLLVAVSAVGRNLGIAISAPEEEEMSLEAIARASRVRVRRVQLTGNWWRTDCGPLLGYRREDNRAIALLPITPARYEIFDPQEQTRIPVNAKTAELVAPTAHTFYPPFPDKALTPFDFIQFALRGRRRELWLLVSIGIAASLLGMVVPQATALIIDNAIPDGDRALLWQIGWGLIAVTFGSSIFQLSQSFVALRLQAIADSSTQAAVWDRLLNLKVSFFRQYAKGDLQRRVAAVSQIRSRLSDTALRSLFTSFFSLLNLGLLFFYNFRLALVALILALIAFIITYISGKINRQKIAAIENIGGEIRSFTVQLINGISKLKVAGAENLALARWAGIYRQQLEMMLSRQKVEDLLLVFNTTLSTTSSLIIFWLAVRLSNNDFSTGTFLAFNVAFGSFISAVISLSNTLIYLVEIRVLWERAEPIIRAQPEIDLSKASPGKLGGKIKLEGVKFRYLDSPKNPVFSNSRNQVFSKNLVSEKSPLVLNDVTIEANPGEFIAIVGPSGSGKSTIVRLMLGFETPSAGTIYYDDKDLAGLDLGSVRRQLGVVLQSSRVSTASIYENIAGGALVTLEDVLEAARMAGLDDDIKKMPMGIHTLVSEGGGNLSGGQRQRLAIARALVLKPRILIFDEATSALDNRTQAIVSESLERLQVTRVAIAHRLSTIRKANRIYVMDKGRVVQKGTFEELSDREGLFARLTNRQIVN